MTVLTDWYDALLDAGFTRAAAIRYLGRETNIDAGTVARVLRRADRPGHESVSTPNPGRSRSDTVPAPAAASSSDPGRGEHSTTHHRGGS